MNEYNPADQQAGIAYAERVASERFASTGEQVNQTTRMLMGCAFEAGVAHGRAVPAGWQLVPVEPSIAMEYAGCKAASRLMGLSEANRVYRAMLAAAPAAPAAPAAQEPVAWQVRNGVVTHGFYRSKKEADEVSFDMQKSHCLSGSLAAFNVRPLYTAPPAAEHPDTVTVPREALEDLRSAITGYVAGSRRSRLEALTRSKELRAAERRVWLAARALLGKEGKA